MHHHSDDGSFGGFCLKVCHWLYSEHLGLRILHSILNSSLSVYSIPFWTLRSPFITFHFEYLGTGTLHSISNTWVLVNTFHSEHLGTRTLHSILNTSGPVYYIPFYTPSYFYITFHYKHRILHALVPIATHRYPYITSICSILNHSVRVNYTLPSEHIDTRILLVHSGHIGTCMKLSPIWIPRYSYGICFISDIFIYQFDFIS